MIRSWNSVTSPCDMNEMLTQKTAAMASSFGTKVSVSSWIEVSA